MVSWLFFCSVLVRDEALWALRGGGRTEGFYRFGDGVEGGLGGAGAVWLVVESHCGWWGWFGVVGVVEVVCCAWWFFSLL